MGEKENQTIGQFIKQHRQEKGWLLRELGAKTKIDLTLLSKIECEERLPTKDQLKLICQAFRIPQSQLLPIWLSDKIIHEIGQEKQAIEALSLAEEKIKYKNNKQ